MMTEILDWRLWGAQVRMVSNLNQGSKPSLVEDDRLKTGMSAGKPLGEPSSEKLQAIGTSNNKEFHQDQKFYKSLG